MEKFWGVTHQSFMVSSHFGAREKGDAKLSFQDHVSSLTSRSINELARGKSVKINL